MDPTPVERSGKGLTYSGVGAITAVVIFFLGVVMMADNSRIGAGWGTGGPQPGYFPFHIGAILCIAAAVVCFQALFGKGRNLKVFVTWDQLRRVLIVLIPTVAYVFLIQYVGIYVASAIFIGGFMRALGKTSWLQTIAVSIGVNVVLFWMFEIQFMVPLPKGPLEAFFGY
ncbi:MAG: tripartite tricarboxylate transporter TctB family protein [Castellaniella sp.]|uniref:tripartite tricarboxylate transporter TctB family protein n=1 Tax=Castellaniella sp. TaxID=1955812 RepID=UPI001219EF6C|nr:tripartite tricarboxylate transporter TctB family protein [Castellaniella sp.]TAN29116.1 MAG: tripartite tricarboxylate transporter TctB family protein [Castellaniella sp.]